MRIKIMPKWKPSKEKAAEYAAKIKELEYFLADHPEIKSSNSRESFYFEIKGKTVRVSNHTVARSDSGCFDEFGNEIRSSYHQEDYDIKITASPVRLPQIWADLNAGFKLNKRGVKIEKTNI
jgi:hypothetical protein